MLNVNRAFSAKQKAPISQTKEKQISKGRIEFESILPDFMSLNLGMQQMIFRFLLGIVILFACISPYQFNVNEKESRGKQLPKN
jgi:hypothetical protein